MWISGPFVSPWSSSADPKGVVWTARWRVFTTGWRFDAVLPGVLNRATEDEGARRIIAGALRGRRLRVPRGLQVRPTADRVKESVFNILGTRPDGARVLDLFAGSGALGLEALSRGAREVVFVES